MMPSGRHAVLLLAIATCAGCRPCIDHVAAVEAIHGQILAAHRDRDAAAWTALEADTLVVGSRGQVLLSPRAERLSRRQRYFEQTRFAVYRDLQPPIVRVARNGSLAWLFAQVEVVAFPAEPSTADSTHTIWAWVELYERRDGRWQLVGNVSNERAGPP